MAGRLETSQEGAIITDHVQRGQPTPHSCWSPPTLSSWSQDAGPKRNSLWGISGTKTEKRPGFGKKEGPHGISGVRTEATFASLGSRWR